VDRAGDARRVTQAVGGRGPRAWVLPLVRSVRGNYAEAPVDRPLELAGFLAAQPPYGDAVAKRVRVTRHRPAAAGMARSRWPVPALPDVGALANWLDLTPPELAWLADARSLDRRAPDQRLVHYRWRTVATRSGGTRVLGAPKPLLRERQRRVLRGILAHVPVHAACHGFVRGHSVATYAAPHAGRPQVLHVDLEGFFASIPAARVYGVFRLLGYPEQVAHTLTALVTTVVPLGVWQVVPAPSDPRLLAAHWRLGRRLAAPHLPQGAPTSPALANLVAHALDRRLAGLAASFGAAYTRYADDLAFSLARGAGALARAVGEVVVDEGFRLNPAKTSVVRSSQRQLLTGLVVNERPGVPRAELDQLRAVLHRCVVDGPGAPHQRLPVPDLEAHLLGRIAWGVSRPDRPRRLRATFDTIDWPCQ